MKKALSKASSLMAKTKSKTISSSSSSCSPNPSLNSSLNSSWISSSRRGSGRLSLKSVPTKEKVATCSVCGRSFDSLLRFSSHRRSCRRNSRYKQKCKVDVDKNLPTCNVCIQVFDTPEEYSDHYCPSPSPSDPEEEKIYSTCSICSRTFTTVRAFNHHTRYCYRAEDEEEFPDVYVDRVSWLSGGSEEYLARSYAEDALKFLNSKPDAIKQFKLVQPGPHQTAMIARGPIVHFNFKAKPRDDPDAPIETFFAQLRMHPSTVVDCCVSLGSKVSDWRSANTRRCKYCVGEVHHPGPAIPCPKLIKGLPKDGDWLYGPDSDDE